jgi:cyclic dehypoxanthinyl futalosine synthase
MLRLAAVSFFNTWPITYGIEHAGLGHGLFHLSYDLPARCAEALWNDTADLALLPLGALGPHLEEVRLVPGVAIASRGKVGTVLLLGEQPREALDTIYLDGASRTSQLLIRLLMKSWKLNPRFLSVDHDQVLSSIKGRHGALLIGDPCFAAAKNYPYVYDLGQAWTTWTGLPFVYAAWVGRPDRVSPEEVQQLQESLAMGLAERGALAKLFAEQNGLDPGECEQYLRQSIHYQFGSAELCGATAFLSRAHAEGLRSIQGALRFYPGKAAKEIRHSGPRTLDSLLSDGAEGRRLTVEEGIRLYTEASLMDLGQAADARRRGLHPNNVVTYIIDRNVNYTNACITACRFCNFYRPLGHPDVYCLSRDELTRKLEETVAQGGVQVLLQGGVNPGLSLAYYEDLFRFIKANFPLAIHGLSPEEIRFLATWEGISIQAVLERLANAGLDSLPGGGAEILDDEIRRRISPNKCSTDVWIEVMRTAHHLGLRSTGTLVFGFGEQPRQLLGHLNRLRTLQDETAGFTAFISWSYQAEGTHLPLLDDTSATRYLRVLSLSRLYLDVIPNMQVSWVTMGPHVGQIGLRFGANDFGSAMIEENVVAQAGAIFKLSSAEIEYLIRAAGFFPRRRNMRYEWL